MNLALSNRILKAKYTIEANKALLDKARLELEQQEELLKTIDLAAEVLKRIGEQKKQATIEMFERVITLAIKEVFGFDYKFVIEVASQGRVSTKFKLICEDGSERDIMTACGGGLIDIVSFVLRALVLASVRPRRSKIMYMDEVFSRVSKEYRPQVASLLKSLAKQLNMQFILVTHQEELIEAGDVVYLLKKGPNGTTAEKQ